MEVEVIKRMREEVPTQIKHTLREDNFLADFFANLTVNFAGTFTVHNFQDMPVAAKKNLKFG